MDEAQESERPDALFQTGLRLYKQQQFEQAWPYFDRAVHGDASLGAAWAFRGATSFALHREPAITLHDLDQALAFVELPTDDAARQLRGLLLGFRGAVLSELRRYAEAQSALEEARQYRQLPAWLALLQGETYYALGQKWPAINAYRIALRAPQRTQASPEVWLKASLAVLELGDPHSAYEMAQVAVQRAPESALSWTRLARTLLALRRYQECLDSIERALALNDQDYFAWGIKGAAMRGLRRYEEARAAYHHAQTLAPPGTKAREPNVLGEFRMLLRLRRFGQAWRLALGEAKRRLAEQQAHR